jgi:DNA-binding transcriptional MerR regulator
MMDAGNSIGAKAPDNWYTRSRAARLINRSPDTLKRWHKSGLFIPSGNMSAGKLKVWLYSDSDIQTLKEVAQKQKPGRKPKTT